MSSDPKYLGPGYWASWHLKTLHSNTAQRKAEVARSIAIDISNFPCMKCRDHAKDYVKRNPLINAVRERDVYSMFYWTVRFHNEVNLRLEKEVISPEKALEMWTGDKSFCTEDCGSDSEAKQSPKPKESEPPEEETGGMPTDTDPEEYLKMLVKKY